MKTRFSVVYIQIFLFLFFTPVFSQWEISTDLKEIQNHDQLRREHTELSLNSASIDSIITATMSSYHIPGLSACILKEGELVWHNAYGYADIERNIPATDSTLFMLASISKTITGTALMQLYERGLFQLDDNVNIYLPQDLQVVNPSYPNNPITFKMILSHVSSMNDDWDILEPLIVAGDSPVLLYDFLKNYLVPGGIYYTNKSYGSYPPATTYNYCNVATALLGYLVEAITDTAFDEYCNEHIFTPLGMNETSWFLANLDTSHIARPYQWTSSGYKPFSHRGFAGYPAGLLRTSSLQLARFLNAFVQKGKLGDIRILDSSTVELMTTAHYPEISLNPFPDSSQGLIWYWDYFGDRRAWGHDGGTNGATTKMYFCEPEKSGVIVLTNGDPTQAWQGVTKITSYLFDYAYFCKEIYAQNVNISSTFVQSGIDSLLILSQFINPENHSFESHAIITSTDKTFIDSLALYDDGKHGDLQASDGNWGNFYILPAEIEKEFSVGVSTVDLNEGDYFALNNLARFTTIGPIVVENYELDAIPNPGENHTLRLVLRNNGLATKATNITAKLSCLDTVAAVSSTSLAYRDPAPGETAITKGFYMLTITQNCPGDIDIPFRVDIMGGGYVFWTDTFSIHVYPTGILSRNEREIPEKYSLEQNYPNPFNPSTTIEFALPKPAFITLKVYNLLGEEVATLLAEQRTAGIHELNWDARGLASGVYLYRLEAGEFVQTKKLILMR